MGIKTSADFHSRQARIALLAASELADLSKRPRIHEEVIRYVLLACGVVSILTTLGIVFVLGSESLRFFSRMGFLNTNQEIMEAISEQDTILHLSGTGSPVKVGDVLQLNEEQMLITQAVDSKTFVVQRGYDGTKPEVHPVDTATYVGERVSLVEFFTGTKWQPQAAEFGVLPLVTATLMTSLIAMLVAGPLGLGVAVYLSEFASTRVRATLKPVLEILAGVPTVVFGYFALTFITPLLRGLLNHGSSEVVGTYNMASAGLVMGIMIIPTISSISEDALSAVPRSLREASYGLGATRIETIFKVLLPAALSGITAAFILGISRAVGETMIVAIASGAGPNFTVNPFAAAETMTGHIARISTGDVSFNSIDYNSLFAIGLTLFLITLVLNLISGAITRRFREVYQ
jgi:phosphate transport system permease protein